MGHVSSSLAWESGTVSACVSLFFFSVIKLSHRPGHEFGLMVLSTNHLPATIRIASSYVTLRLALACCIERMSRPWEPVTRRKLSWEKLSKLSSANKVMIPMRCSFKPPGNGSFSNRCDFSKGSPARGCELYFTCVMGRCSRHLEFKIDHF